jgi:hypothetical protein
MANYTYDDNYIYINGIKEAAYVYDKVVSLYYVTTLEDITMEFAIVDESLDNAVTKFIDKHHNPQTMPLFRSNQK